MKQIKKRKLTKKQLLLIVTSSLLVLVTAATVLITTLVTGDHGTEEEKDPPEILEGEALYLNTAIAYPRVEESSISYILVQNSQGRFDLTRTEELGSFWLGYDVGEGAMNMVLHTPPIMGAEGSFDYTSLYSKEEDDNYGGIYKLTYLSVALGTPYFSERISLPKNRTEREAMLATYGFNKPTVETISFVFADKDADGKEKDGMHSITIGGRAVSGSGYYFMVDDRDYVYYTSTPYFDYALQGFHSFINGRLVAEGIPTDSVYEPFLTTDFKEWVKEKHAEEGERIEDGSLAVLSGYSYLPKITEPDYIPPEGSQEDGYQQLKYMQLSFDLDEFRIHPDFERIRATVTSLSVGKLDSPVTVTLIDEHAASESMMLELGDGKTVGYRYQIVEIESVITETEEKTAAGTPVGDSRYVKVTYFPHLLNDKGEYTLATKLARHAIIDMQSTLIPEEARAALAASSVGYVADPIFFNIDYTAENSTRKVVRTVIDDIVEVYDSTGAVTNKITETSLVVLRCHDEINGVSGESRTWHLNMKSVATIENGEAIRSALLGRSKSNGVGIVADEETTYYQALIDFTAYRIEEANYFITSHLVTSFRFVNASERDPYYGESFYENTMDNEYRFYGLNASSCEKVVQYLGGVGNEGTVASEGFEGETVAVGLTHATMDKYGLYAYEIYFELPRGIQDASESGDSDIEFDENMLSDYSWYGTLGFTLFISEKQYDPDTGAPFRYVGSDMYDIVAIVRGDELDFVELDFAEFWARRHMMLADITTIEEVEVDFGMTDVYGSYSFEVEKRDLYVGTNEDNKLIADYVPFEGATKTNKYFVNISAAGERMDTEFEKVLNSEGYKYDVVSVTNLYNVVQNGGEPLHHSIVDTEGVAQFKAAYELMQVTQYTGTVDSLGEQMREAADARVAEGNPDLRIRFKLSTSSYYYTYEFYRFSDRCVQVRVFQSNSKGQAVTPPLNDFYISTLSFKKIVTAYVNVLNGKTVDIGAGYDTN